MHEIFHRDLPWNLKKINSFKGIEQPSGNQVISHQKRAQHHTPTGKKNPDFLPLSLSDQAADRIKTDQNKQAAGELQSRRKNRRSRKQAIHCKIRTFLKEILTPCSNYEQRQKHRRIIGSRGHTARHIHQCVDQNPDPHHIRDMISMLSEGSQSMKSIQAHYRFQKTGSCM